MIGVVAGLSNGAFIACLLIVFIGAVIQGTLGIGLGLVASPVLALADPAFIPGVIVITVLPLTVGVALREHASIDRRGVFVALVGRLPGVVLGSAAVALTGPRFIAIAVGVSVLAAVIASFAAVRFQTTPRALLTAGFASGFMGTATGVGGPPMAITYQHSDPSVMRATISMFFTIGSIMSVVALVLAGEIGRRQWQLAALVVPAVLIGFMASQVFARRLRSNRIRPLILVLCAASAIALLVEEFT